MYHAKASGRNNYQFFTVDMNKRAVLRLSIENNLRRALLQSEFELYYQPKIHLASGRMTGCEALIRWHDPDLGLVEPAEFVGIAEECGLIVPIGRWLLREACRQLTAWQAAGLAIVPVSVNISALEFRHINFLDGVALIFKEIGLAPRFVEMELTESILMHDLEVSTSVLQALKDMGLQLAIDDFGTGYSSLSYLNRFPIDTLKIDQSFMRDLATNGNNASIVSAVIGMGKSLHQKVIAEGVETAEQVAILQGLECDEGQGYWFNYPLRSEEFALLLGCENAQMPV
jgi:EAL domain-containing protein (putative c-di-GMP-specific phosphodiesterase class I)